MSDKQKTEGVKGTSAKHESEEATAVEEASALDPAEDALVAKKVVHYVNVEDETWVFASDGTVPDGALIGGEEYECVTYVARVEHPQGDLIPGKLVPEKGVCYVAWGGKEYYNSDYEVLIIPQDQVTWLATNRDEDIPPNAISGGVSAKGETLYIGRVPQDGGSMIGKVHNARCYISHLGDEYSYFEYEILVKNG